MEELRGELFALYEQYLAHGEDGREIVDEFVNVAVEIGVGEGDDVISRMFGK